MKKRITALLITLVLIITAMPVMAFAETSEIEDKEVYYTPASDYKSGDCILTATKMMIRRGIISSNKKIKKVTVKILNKKGEKVISSYKKPNAKKFDLLEIDAEIMFGTLKKGTYTYQVIATDTAQTMTLINKQFKVVK